MKYILILLVIVCININAMDCMKELVTIDYLKNHPEHVSTCAQWSFNQWGRYTPERTLQSFIESRKKYLNIELLPFTLVAFEDQKPIGMVSLAESKEICPDLLPWLSTIYVTPERRRKGIGKLLEQKICAKALEKGYKKIYLYTSHKDIVPWYEKLGWHKRSTEWLRDHFVTVMEKELA